MPVLSTVGSLATFKSLNFGTNFPFYAEFQQEIPIENFAEISPFFVAFRQQSIVLVSASDGGNPIKVKTYWSIS